MRKSKPKFFTFLALGFILLNTACAQPQLNGRDYVNEENLVQQSTVLLNNASYIVPLQNLENLKIASVHFANPQAAAFDSLLNKYSKVVAFNGADYFAPKTLDNLSADLKWFNTIIVQLTDVDLSNPQVFDFINSNQKLKHVIICFFGSADALAKLNNPDVPVIWSQRVGPVAAFFSAQAVFGGEAISQKLTSNISPLYKINMGFTTTKTRLQYTVPEAAGINSSNLGGIDDIAAEAMLKQATPGCVVLVVKDGKVIFNKAYGYHTYDKTQADKLTDIFDLASMTKISATTMETMLLYDQGLLDINAKLGYYLPLARNTNKNDILVREVLLHQAGLIPDIPGFELVKATDHATDSSATYPTKVNDNYFLRKDYFKEVMWPQMLNSSLKTRDSMFTVI